MGIRSTARLVALATVMGACGGLGAGPAIAQGSCGGVQLASPPHWHRAYRPPLAIGDSTMLLALPNLAREGFAVNAHGCRQFDEALTLLRGLARARRLPHMVVVALGGDGSVTPGDVSQTLRILGPRRTLVLVTPRELGGGSNSNASVVREEGRTHPDRIHVLDWVAFSAGRGGWFQPDGLHLTFSGAAAFAGLLRRAQQWAAPPPPQPLSCPRPAPTPGESPLNPQTPNVSLAIPNGLLMTAVSAKTISAPAVNGNPFAVAARAELAEFDPKHPNRSRPTLASTCLMLPANATVPLAFVNDDTIRRLLALRQRFTIQIVVRLADSGGVTATVRGVYLLERPPRRPGAR